MVNLSLSSFEGSNQYKLLAMLLEIVIGACVPMLVVGLYPGENLVLFWYLVMILFTYWFFIGEIVYWIS